MLRKNYGCVRVDFAQPFSLKVSVCWSEAASERWRGSVWEGLGPRSASSPASVASASSLVKWGLCQQWPFLHFSTKVPLSTKDSKHLSLGDFGFNIYCYCF